MMVLVCLSLSCVVTLCLLVGFAVYKKDDICRQYPWFFFCTAPQTPPPKNGTGVVSGSSSSSGSGGSSGSSGSSGSRSRVFAPYLLVTASNTSKISRTRWTTLAFVVGYANGKILWDAGSPSVSKMKGSGKIIVSFGGQSCGVKNSKYFGELAGKYKDAVSLSKAYEAVAKDTGATWLDFDVEVDATKDTASCTRRHAALAALQKRNRNMKVSFTVPTEKNGLPADTKSMLTAAKRAGVKISVVNMMTMYFTTKREDMSDAAWSAVEASRTFIRGLGATIGVTPQIGKNPGSGYTHENFTLQDSSQLVSKAAADPDVTFLSFWELGRDQGGQYESKFRAF